ncbi:fibronectin type III domain-containing protein [Myxococcus sp. CA033]|uniref:fibronectin type III domain-containing protein n=1 Tax=Myxococcus sp. CA033 TaxID=2741516 RepID=UPI00157AF80F|nr:fibronectin type III domain-containing protein [Myxococcus sp. CA033]
MTRRVLMPFAGLCSLLLSLCVGCGVSSVPGEEEALPEAARVSSPLADTEAPPVPTGLSILAANSGVILSWDPSPAADLKDYAVRYRVVGQTTPSYKWGVGAPPLTLPGLVNGVTYAFEVKAQDTSGNASAYCAAVNATPTPTGPDVTPPVVPGQLVATPGDTVLGLTWSANTEPDFRRYTVKYRAAGAATYSYRYSLTQPLVTLTGLVNGTTYELMVKAEDLSGNASGYATPITATPAASTPQCPTFGAPVNLTPHNIAILTDASGLAASRANAQVVWTHNDRCGASGGNCVEHVYALSAVDGHFLGTYTLSSNPNLDWEDMAMGPGPVSSVDYVYVGRIGDNNGLPSVREVVRFPEPTVSVAQAPVTVPVSGVERFPFTYPGGVAPNAEAMFVDTQGDIYIVTKAPSGHSQVYRYAVPLNAPGVSRTLELVAELDFLPGSTAEEDRVVTGGAISPDGGEILIKTYTHTFLWKRHAGQSVPAALLGTRCEVTNPGYSEALTFAPDGSAFFSLGEGNTKALKRVTRL